MKKEKAELMGRKIKQITQNCMQWKSILRPYTDPNAGIKEFGQVKASHRQARHSKQCVIEIIRMGESDPDSGTNRKSKSK